MEVETVVRLSERHELTRDVRLDFDCDFYTYFELREQKVFNVERERQRFQESRQLTKDAHFALPVPRRVLQLPSV